MENRCPNCKELNPKVAKFCMYCNTQLVEEEFLSEEDKLRKEIAELKEEKELLKRNKELEKELFEKLIKEIKSTTNSKTEFDNFEVCEDIEFEDSKAYTAEKVIFSEFDSDAGFEGNDERTDKPSSIYTLPPIWPKPQKKPNRNKQKVQKKDVIKGVIYFFIILLIMGMCA